MILATVHDCYRCTIFCVRNLDKFGDQIEFLELPKFIGLGDLFAYAMMRFGFESCERCQVRQRKLNQWFPFFWVDKRRRSIWDVLLENKVQLLPALLDNNEIVPLDLVDKDFENVIMHFEKLTGYFVD